MKKGEFLPIILILTIWFVSYFFYRVECAPRHNNVFCTKKNELNPELVGNTFIFVRLPQRFSTYFLHWNVFREKKNRRNWIHLHWCWRKWAELLNVLCYTSTRTAAHHCVVYRPKADFFSAKKRENGNESATHHHLIFIFEHHHYAPSIPIFSTIFPLNSKVFCFGWCVITPIAKLCDFQQYVQWMLSLNLYHFWMQFSSKLKCIQQYRLSNSTLHQTVVQRFISMR